MTTFLVTYVFEDGRDDVLGWREAVGQRTALSTNASLDIESRLVVKAERLRCLQ